MPNAAVVEAVSADGARPSRTRRGQDAGSRLSALGDQIGYGRPAHRLRPGRGQLAIVALVIVGFWLVVVFGQALTELNSATAREAAASAEGTTLQQRLDADRRELEIVQTDAFQGILARAYGLGAPGEIAFSLDANAPSPEPITPLGSVPGPAQQETPLDAWLQLLFGD
jgi:hypothetical protein